MDCSQLKNRMLHITPEVFKTPIEFEFFEALRKKTGASYYAVISTLGTLKKH